MALQAQNISVGYGPGKVVFSGISFTAQPGHMVALLGVNGIGKSTLLRTVAGIQPPVQGSVFIQGKNIAQTTAAEKAALVSVVLTERLGVDNLTVYHLIALGRAPYTGWMGNLTEADRAVVDEVIALLQLQPLQQRYYNRLSDGERQKVMIARALCQQTPVVVLDEPTAFLDFRNKKAILQILANVCSQMGKTVILSTHDIDAALDYCTTCWIMTEKGAFTQVDKGPAFKADVCEKLGD